jgi:nucleoside-diphosphate-sugar epimerase
MNILVTGAAGFIGSHLCRALIRKEASVIGIDSFTDFYPRWIKQKNIQPLLNHPKFKFISEDIIGLDLKKEMEQAEAIFHLAAQPGVRSSWGGEFSIYTKNNIDVTQRLLETAKNVFLKKFIYASSSSVYGLSPRLPMTETQVLHPYSPYGVTKLAAENLCFLYHKNYGIPCVSLRFFTVYGPGQRPDMAFHRFFKAIREDNEIKLYGDGEQTRDFTFIDDIIEANISSICNGIPGETYNIGGGTQIKLIDIIPVLEKICKKKIKIKCQEGQKGDVRHTFADIEKAKKDLDYIPQVSLEDGLREEWDWIQNIYKNDTVKKGK